MKEIKVCSCGAPLIFTFAFAYKEYLCLDCGSTYPMLGRDYAPATPELRYKEKMYKKIWKALYGSGFFLPRSRYGKSKCEKCTHDNHQNHLSKSEILKDKVATEIFNRLIKSKQE